MKPVEDENILSRHARIILGEASSEAETLTRLESITEIEEPFPSGRTIRWSPTDSQAALPDDDLKLVVTQDVLIEVDRHTRSTLERELGGFLLGNLYRCPNTGSQFVLIDQLWEARFTVGNEVSLRLTTDTWADLADQMQTRFRGKLLVGWYHSHPRMSVFLSGDDLELHEARFSEPWMFALVVEPLTKQGGFFGQLHGQLHPTIPIPFHEYFGHRMSSSVVDWSNYHCRAVESPGRADTDEGQTVPENEIHSEMGGRTDLHQLQINYHPVRRRRSIVRSVLAFVTITLLILLSGYGIRQWNTANSAIPLPPGPKVECSESIADQNHRSAAATDQNGKDQPSADGQVQSSGRPPITEVTRGSNTGKGTGRGARQDNLPGQRNERQRNGHKSNQRVGPKIGDKKASKTAKGATQRKTAEKEPKASQTESTDKSQQKAPSSPSANDERNK
jgi:proteasome lid subunit RPN8/RPN11